MSYTVDTLAALHAQMPQDEWFLLLGSDSLADLPNWREPERICMLATPVVVRRAGGPDADFGPIAEFVPAERLKKIRGLAVEMPLVEFSSSDIRRRVAAGHSIRYRTPCAVEQYIAANRLYRPQA